MMTALPGPASELPSPDEMYDALVARDSRYEGIFIVGVKTTGIFCRPVCPARKPRRSNVEFFANPRDALLAGYRACLRCKPLERAGTTPPWLRELLAAVEADASRRWRDADLRGLGLEPARVRRWFLKQHGMTFHGYCRARRLGAALGQIQQGDALLMTGMDNGYDSASGFREAFQKLFGVTAGRGSEVTPIVVNRVTTPLGPMIAAATAEQLCLLEFVDRRMLQTQIDRLRKLLSGSFVPGNNAVLAQLQGELDEYFAGQRRAFSVPMATPGTEFQQRVWQQLSKVGYGRTCSYADQARAIGKPNAFRAVARANGDNRIAILIPCHRVLGANGELCGYGGQLWRKKALLELEQGVRELVFGDG